MHKHQAIELSTIDRIRIAAPCKANWSDMQGDDRKRHCGDCSKEVYDLSAMTKAEAEQFLWSVVDAPCVKLYRRLDGTIIFDNCPRGLREIRNAVRRAGRVVSLFLVVAFSFLSAGAKDSNADEGKEKPSNFNLIWTLSESGPTTKPKMKTPNVKPNVQQLQQIGSVDRYSYYANLMGTNSQTKGIGTDWPGADAFSRALQLVEKRKNKDAIKAFGEALVACSKPECDPMYKEFVGVEYAKLLTKMGKKAEALVIIQTTKLKKVEDGATITEDSTR